jgi:tRNA(fMet)-specific endonuclease VapC
LEQAGQLTGPNDLLIAAIAIAHQVTLVTHNTREFQRVEGLQVDDWEAA